MVFEVQFAHERAHDLVRYLAIVAEPDKFAAIEWSRTKQTGSPHIDGVLAWIDCDIEEVLPGGDHDIVVGRVRDLGTTDAEGPLVFYRGGYGRYEV